MDFYNVVIANFIRGSNEDMFFKAYDEITTGYILVETQWGFEVAKVKEVLSLNEFEERFNRKLNKEVVCNIDLNRYYERKDNKKRRDALKKKIEKLIKTHNQNCVYETMAEKYPDVKELYDEYKNIGEV